MDQAPIHPAQWRPLKGVPHTGRHPAGMPAVTDALRYDDNGPGGMIQGGCPGMGLEMGVTPGKISYHCMQMVPCYISQNQIPP